MTAAVGPLIGAGVSLFTGLKSASAQKKAQAAQDKQAALADARERRRLLRSTQIAQGQALNFGANVGGLGSSGLVGGIMNVGNQAQSQIGFQNTSLQLAKQSNQYLQQASNWNMAGDFLNPLFRGMSLGNVGFSGGQFGYTPS